MQSNKNTIQARIEADRANSPAKNLTAHQIAVKVANEIYKKDNPDFIENVTEKNR